MSDSESAVTAPPAHPTLGGKSLQSLERPRYKSWRKKYRKMRHNFDGVLEENKRYYKEEQKLEGIAKRLREELDGLLELLLDLNQNPALPPDLRFNVSLPQKQDATSDIVPTYISPEDANKLLMEYTTAVRGGHIPPLDLHVVREQIDERLAAQDVEALNSLEASVSHTIGPLPPEPEVEQEPVNYLTSEQEDAYLARMDAKAGGDPYDTAPSTQKEKEREVLAAQEKEKHWAELTPREAERQAELQNPQSQHNWLKTHTKVLTNLGGTGDDDADSVASHEKTPASSRKRGGKDKNLAKQVGDRAVERAREGWSPGGASGMDEDEGAEDPAPSAGKKRVRDPDGTYRLKGGSKGKGEGSKGGKRKRSGEDVAGNGKRAKVEGEGV